MYQNIPVTALFPSSTDGYVESPKVSTFELNLGVITEEEAYVVSFTINRLYAYTEEVYMDLREDAVISGIIPSSMLTRVLKVAGEILTLIRS
jgi:hypothetical protein